MLLTEFLVLGNPSKNVSAFMFNIQIKLEDFVWCKILQMNGIVLWGQCVIISSILTTLWLCLCKQTQIIKVSKFWCSNTNSLCIIMTNHIIQMDNNVLCDANAHLCITWKESPYLGKGLEETDACVWDQSCSYFCSVGGSWRPRCFSSESVMWVSFVSAAFLFLFYRWRMTTAMKWSSYLINYHKDIR